MNIIVSNKQKQIIDNANIDAIKDLNGLFNVDDLINKFKNYFFNKMILDATSIVNFTSNDVLEKLAREIGSEKLYILLPSSPEPPQSFINKLLELHIYNFSTNINDIVGFLVKPNTYDSFFEKEKADDFYVDNSIKEGNNSYDDNINNGYGENFNDGIQLVDDNTNYSQSLNVANSHENRFIPNEVADVSSIPSNRNGKRIIGFKNVTTNAGSTTLCYLLYQLLKKLGKSVQTIEVNKDDYKYYQDKDMMSLSENDIDRAIQNVQSNIIIIDLNNCKNLSFCTDVFYLVEPSVIKLNKLMIDNRFAFRELYKKSIILNKSLLSNQDIEMLSKEAGVSFFYNIPPLNDRVENEVLKDLLHKISVK